MAALAAPGSTWLQVCLVENVHETAARSSGVGSEGRKRDGRQLEEQTFVWSQDQELDGGRKEGGVKAPEKV